MQQSPSEDWFLTGLKKHLTSPEFKAGQALRDSIRKISRPIYEAHGLITKEKKPKRIAGLEELAKKHKFDLEGARAQEHPDEDIKKYLDSL